VHNFFTHKNKLHAPTYRDYYKAMPSAPDKPQKPLHIKDETRADSTSARTILMPTAYNTNESELNIKWDT